MAGGIEWFRWHHGSVTDPKFQLVARKAGASLPDVLAVWAYLLEQASASEKRGEFSIDAEAVDCMFGFPVTETRTAAILAAMAARGLLDDCRIASWEKRQPKRERIDDTSTERVRAFRQKQRDETPGNATERTETPREEKRREEIEQREIHTPSLSATDGGRVCGLMRQAGLSDGNPGHPDLLALIAAGATDGEFVGAAQAAVGKGKGFAYAIGTLKRQRIDAASSAAVMHAGPMPTGPPDRKATQLQVAALMTGTSRPPQPREIIDVTPRVLIA